MMETASTICVRCSIIIENSINSVDATRETNPYYDSDKAHDMMKQLEDIRFNDRFI